MFEPGPRKRLEEINQELDELVKGTLTYKTINGKRQPYIQRTIDGRTVSYYVKTNERERILMEIEQKNALLEEKKHILAYLDGLSDILSKNPHLDAKVSTGYQDLEYFIDNDFFYIDKTEFITKWWKSPDRVTLITRPRRFGKTLLLSTVEQFFSPLSIGTKEYFTSLKVWKDKEINGLHGSIPVVFVTFAGIKPSDYESFIPAIACEYIFVYNKHKYLVEDGKLQDREKQRYEDIYNGLRRYEPTAVFNAIKVLCELLHIYYGARPIILLDEYDSPIQEAYGKGYLKDVLTIFRQIFNNSLKTNYFYQKALLTGTTKISKNAIFSDMNQLQVDSVTKGIYGEYFGFTEKEVMDALRCQNIQEMDKVKAWYDGFHFGEYKDIYNPWSISCYMSQRSFESFWINTSNNNIIGELIRSNSVELKNDIEDLIQGKSIHKVIDEDLAIEYIDGSEGAFWSLLLAVGYVRASNIVREGNIVECDIEITNYETRIMFDQQLKNLRENRHMLATEFVNHLLNRDMERLNLYINALTRECISYYDTAHQGECGAPENFYHGLVLGMIASLRKEYRITSNRESGLGRYDIAMTPIKEKNKAFIIEFKVFDPKKEKTIEDTVKRAFEQIEEKEYEAGLIAQGVDRENIVKMAFAFDGKDVLVEEKCARK